MSTIELEARSIVKRYGPLVANDHIDLSVLRGEVHAVMGENGAGKSTLMSILYGMQAPDSGQIFLHGAEMRYRSALDAIGAGMGMVHQAFKLFNSLTVWENVVYGMEPTRFGFIDRREAARRVSALAERYRLQVDPNAVVGQLSVGVRQRVEILKALYRDARILILDEPTAVLTPAETDALFATLKLLVGQGLSIIFISHKLNEVMAVSDRVLVLRAGKLAGERVTAETSRGELAALMVGQEVEQAAVPPSEPGPLQLVLNTVSTARRGTGVSLDRISLSLRGGEITGLAGVSGNGQAALAALISGMERPASGEIVVRGVAVRDWSPRTALSSGIARIPEDRHAVGTIGDMSVTENVIAEAYRTPRFSRRGFLDWRAARKFAEEIIADYDVKCPSPEARIRLLSGGNMQKLILGRALDPDPSVILANQPTRGLDVGAVGYVHRKLIEARERGAAILLISEDLEEILALSDRIIVMSKGRLSPSSARGERSVAELGELMAGHGLEAA